MIDDRVNESAVDGLAAVGYDRPQLSVETLGQLACRSVGACRLRRPVDTDDDLLGNAWFSFLFRAISTEQGELWMTSVAVEPITKPARRPRPPSQLRAACPSPAPAQR